MSTEFYFCSPVLALPGSKPFAVIEKCSDAQYAICKSGIDTHSCIKQSNETPVIPFPKPQ